MTPSLLRHAAMVCINACRGQPHSFANGRRADALVHFAFDSGAVRFWSGIGDLVWEGNTCVGAGGLGSVGTVEESAPIRAAGAAFKLSGIPSSLVSIVFAEHYQGRSCTMWLAFFDAAGARIVDPVQVFSGRIDVMHTTDARRLMAGTTPPLSSTCVRSQFFGPNGAR